MFLQVRRVYHGLRLSKHTALPFYLVNIQLVLGQIINLSKLNSKH